MHILFFLPQDTNMINLLIRFLLVYFFMAFSMKLMGKRQVGQLQMSELITALFLSELATYSVTDPDIPLLFGILPILVLICIEVILSFLSVQFQTVKRAFDFSPSALIANGTILQKELQNNRITLEELLSQLRLSGIFDPQTVEYAFLEPNGQFSILEKSKYLPSTKEDLNIKCEGSDFCTAVIVDGSFREKSVKEINRDKKWVLDQLKRRKIDFKSVFLATADHNGMRSIILKDRL